MSWLEPLLQRLDRSIPASIIHVDGQDYSDRELYKIPQYGPVTPIQTNTLDSLVTLLDPNKFDPTLTLPKNVELVHVCSPTHVQLRGPIEGPDNYRQVFAEAFYRTEPFTFGKFLNVELFSIELMSRFEETPHQKAILKVLNNLSLEDGINIADNGIAQSVTVKQNISLVETEVKPIVELTPRRTFTEVNQPTSKFNFRLRKSGEQAVHAALFEADGGHWKIEAISHIAKYLSGKLPIAYPVVA